MLNYSRIYGAGAKSAKISLQEFNPKLTPYEAAQNATKMFSATKGVRRKVSVQNDNEDEDEILLGLKKKKMKMVSQLNSPT